MPSVNVDHRSAALVGCIAEGAKVWDKPLLNDLQKKVLPELLLPTPAGTNQKAFIIAATGSGKTLIVQLVAFILSGVVLVVAPILALGADLHTKIKPTEFESR